MVLSQNWIWDLKKLNHSNFSNIKIIKNFIIFKNQSKQSAMNKNLLKFEIRTTLICLLFFVFISSLLTGQNPMVNYNENTIPRYILPDPLIFNSGELVNDANDWIDRRSEILSMFENEMFGKTPSKKLPVTFEIISFDKNALNGKATRKEVTAYFTSDKKGQAMTILIYLPNNTLEPVPLFFGMNFYGNHTIQPDTDISITKSWVPDNEEFGIAENKANERSRGMDKSSWPVERIIERGYGLATIYYGDLDPDFDDGFQNGIQPLFYKVGQTSPKANEWGSIGAWAWGCSRAMDYFKTDRDIDYKRIVLMGHSRLGKTALWSGAQDQRFAIVISNNSGCGGAALSKRIFGETVGTINRAFPHWFCGNFKKYNENEKALRFDQHMLLSLIAPRPLYVASAEEDLWADPLGEFLAAKHASPVYKLLGTDGLQVKVRPPLNQPVMSTIGYHIRPGKHEVTGYDWECFMDFADKYLKKR
jgi:hypothetical protein